MGDSATVAGTTAVMGFLSFEADRFLSLFRWPIKGKGFGAGLSDDAPGAETCPAAVLADVYPGPEAVCEVVFAEYGAGGKETGAGATGATERAILGASYKS